MIQTTTLLPPPSGPMANPLLFGVAAGLAALFPPTEPGGRDANGLDGGRDNVADGVRQVGPGCPRG